MKFIVWVRTLKAVYIGVLSSILSTLLGVRISSFDVNFFLVHFKHKVCPEFFYSTLQEL